MDHDIGIGTSQARVGAGGGDRTRKATTSLDGDDGSDGDGTGGGAPGSGSGSGRGGQGAGGEKRRKQKHPRKILSCTVCIRRKSKCNHLVPCDQCLKRGAPEDCVVQGRRSASLAPNAGIGIEGTGTAEDQEVRGRVAALEELVGTLVAGIPAPPPPQKVDHPLNSGSPSLDALFSLLPSPEITQLLYESYVDRSDTILHVLHLGTLADDFGNLEKIRKVVREGDELPIGVSSLESWLVPRLANIFMVLTLGLYFLPYPLLILSPSNTTNSTTTDLQLETWILASERSLTLASWTSKPQLRTIQTVLLFAVYFRNTGTISHPQFYLRSVGTQLWWLLVALEWDVSARCRGHPTVSIQDFAATPPQNYNDLDLVFGPGIEPRALTEWTAASHTIYYSNICLVTEQWMFLRTAKDEWRSVIPDSQISSLVLMEGVMRELVARLPPHYQLTSPTHGVSSKILFQRLDLNKDCLVRRLRMNRHNVVAENQSDLVIAQSRKSCLECASVILAIIEDVHQRFDFARKLC
ncbi:hypothetical protein RQP46_009295 [Phenoliferia psychrophenolica]